MHSDRKDRWLPAYLTWISAYIALSIALGLAVAAWDRALILPGEPGFVEPQPTTE